MVDLLQFWESDNFVRVLGLDRFGEREVRRHLAGADISIQTIIRGNGLAPRYEAPDSGDEVRPTGALCHG
jgi:hypothetical protein